MISDIKCHSALQSDPEGSHSLVVKKFYMAREIKVTCSSIGIEMCLLWFSLPIPLLWRHILEKYCNQIQ